ncbi:DivIVA domain-containing protein [Frankia sp. CNm7]|uniref:Cell wall synthesis protein Wag31 n=1 Tax=Frankia nepalensis TaxID=1836974 RepID=A0A937UMF8_9ACTN|nr:DivIVA domain-containing protein [Frankia nepalensis]MBL7500369.1 DivIVA domain-containing protein [Frankia nepalensis]MBL7508667.1 DivIVA domain-containing protein [Frankia nepalensis]MBL7522994.1 DivIVA domain-containing protein [Frankia nepalensis]MBL7628829.1 DivIVA domain-containing protein [Frankia nepalensis]
MALTPQDVQNKVFSPTRFRTGYNEDEVDTFLDEVEAELTRLLDENADVRRQLDEARRAGGGGPGVPAQLIDENQALRRQLDEARRAAAQAQAAAQQAQAQAQAVAARGPSTSPVPIPGGATQVIPAVGSRTPAPTASGSPAIDQEIEQRVARTLVLAQRTADEALREARAESERARREARQDADRILAEARAHVAEQLGGLEEDKRRLEGQVEQLRAFEREYRTRLRAYLEMQLRDLDGMPTQPAVGAGGPQRPGLNPGTQGGQPQQAPQPAAVGVPAGAYQPGPQPMAAQNGGRPDHDPRAGNGMQEF